MASGIAETMKNEFNRGCRYTRDEIIAVLIGFQNEQGNKVNTQEYKAYQKVMVEIQSRFGKFMT